MKLGVLIVLCMAIATSYSQQNSYCGMVPPNSWNKHSTGMPSVFISAPKCYKPGEKVIVDLFSDITIPFTAFIIKAHVQGSEIPIGQWEVMSPLESVNCVGGMKNVLVMPSSLNMQKLYTNVTWMAPQNLYSNIIFNATFTDTNGDVWKNVTSSQIKYNATCGKVNVKPAEKDICKLLPTSMVKMDNSKNNYGIILSQNCFRSRDVIKVELFSDISTPFYGFALQAHVQRPNKMMYGRFIKRENSRIMYKGCNGMDENTLYMDRSSSSMVLVQTEWTPGAPINNAVVMFNATIIDKNGYSVVNITSLPLTYDFNCGENVIPSGKPSVSDAPKMMMSLFSVVMMLVLALNM